MRYFEIVQPSAWHILADTERPQENHAAVD